MSRVPASVNMTWTRGSTVEFGFRFKDSDGTVIGGSPIEARLQVRPWADRFGTTTATTLLLELTTEGADPTLAWDTIAGEVSLTAQLAPEVHDMLNHTNLKKVKYAYSLELFTAGDAYVVSPVAGSINVLGETTR